MNITKTESSLKTRGFALVLVLAFLGLMVALIVAFLTRASSEQVTASGSLSAVSARQLADTAVSLVQGQINLATGTSTSLTWTSQPGMVRTFNSAGAVNAFKLYSADTLIAPGDGNPSNDAPAADWDRKKAIWTDINAPVTDVAGNRCYPVIGLSEDDNASGTSGVGGYKVSKTTGITDLSVPPPMPVKWLYVLRDGTLVSPSAGPSDTSAIIAGESYPSRRPNDPNGNPIIGRVAFWTDDDTCKVNVNTASEGSFWDVPHVASQQDQNLANYQPAQHEFQAYPGHPATVSLSAVLPNLNKEQYFTIAPREVWGGSQQGTVISSGTLTADTDRLYSSVDEMIFAVPARDPSPNGLDKNTLEKRRFFLTAHSRAPEVNLFNLPRIACWPIFENLAKDRVTAFDKLIAFCSTVNGHPYYFQRKDCFSATNDISIGRNMDLYGYLQYLTGLKVPGFGTASFQSKYPQDRDQILTEIFDYIRSTNLFDDNLEPGKIGSDMPFTPGRVFQDLGKSYGVYVSKRGHGSVVPTVLNNTKGLGRFFTLSEFGVGFICNADAADTQYGSNDAVKNKALADVPLSVGQKSIQAIIITEFFSAMHGFTLMRPDLRIQIKGLGNMTITDSANVTQKLFPNDLDDKVLVCNSSPDNVQSNRSLGGRCDWRYQFAMNGEKGKDTPDVNNGAAPKGAPPRGNVPGDSVLPKGNPRAQEDIFPFIGIPVKISATGGVMTLNETNLTVEIYAGDRNGSKGDLIQTIDIKLPGASIPIPKLCDKQLKYGSTDLPRETWWNFPVVYPSKNYSFTDIPTGRLRFALENPQGSANSIGQFFFDGFDVVRTVLPKHGDYRLVAGQTHVLNDVFVEHRNYRNTGVMLASNLGGATDSSDTLKYYDTGGKYLANASYPGGIAPDIRADALPNERPERSGDFDTGVGRHSDGPYINKPDEGDSARNQTISLIPYLSVRNDLQIPGGPTFFSPNRQMPSPGMFGSLPTGVKSGTPWQTLLFRPQPSHPQSVQSVSQLPDHLLLDLFWMPVVEPYAISDRFSTAGKINMNYQIVPFTYIERSTGLRAVLKSEKVTAIPTTKAGVYKWLTTPGQADIYRLDIDADETLLQFTQRFALSGTNVFISPSEICDLWIVPKNSKLKSMPTFWDANKLTGDNLRERIYTTLYPKLTTKSNTFTVHFRAQALRKSPSSPAGTWTEDKDIVTGEYRGSTTIERFIDPNAPVPDYATETDTKASLSKYYKWRVIANKQFSP